MSIGKVAKCHIAMGAWIVIRKKARACPGRGFIPWASGGQPRHHITSLLLNVPGLFNHHLPHLLEIGVRKGSLCICHPGSRLICRSHRDEACAAGWQGVDRMWTCGNNTAPTFLWRLCFVWCRHQESNPGPTDYKSVALPTELYRRVRATIIAIGKVL